MPKVNPGQRAEGEHTIPAAQYILALVWFRRQQAKSSGNDYIRCKWEVCDGELKGRTFFANIATDVSKEGTLLRWQIFAEACGVTEEFEIGDSREGSQDQGDADIRRLFLGRPIVADVKRETQGAFTNNDIQRFVFRSSWTDDQKDAMVEWRAEWKRKAEQRSTGDEHLPDPPDDGWDDYVPVDPNDAKQATTNEPGDFDEIPF